VPQPYRTGEALARGDGKGWAHRPAPRQRLKRWALARLLEPKNKPAAEGGLFDADQTRSMPKMGDFNYDCFDLRTLGR
jgi:hypothetical protein